MAFILMVACVLLLTNPKIANCNQNLKWSNMNDLDLPTKVLSKREAVDIEQVSKVVSEYVAPVMIVAETAEVAISVYKDFNDGTIHNTVETVAGLYGGYGGANTGAYLGASIGSFICPGPGTAFGAFFGGIYGGFYGAYTAREAVKIVTKN